MTDQTQTQTPETPAAEVEVEPTRLEKIVTKHPRAARVVAITGGVLAAVGVGVVATNLKKNKHHIDAAGAHVLEAGSEISEAVSPTPETTDA